MGPAALLWPAQVEGLSGRPGGVQGTRLISDASVTVDQPDQTEEMCCNRLSTHYEPQWLYLGGRPSSGPGHLPGTTRGRGDFPSSSEHPSPATQNPPTNNRCRQTLFPPATARNALFQFPQCPGVIMKTVIKELQNRVEKHATRFQRTLLCSPPWMVSANVISDWPACHCPCKAGFCQGS